MEAAWKEVLAANNEEAKERTIVEAQGEEKRKVKRYIYQSKKKVNEVWKEDECEWKQEIILEGK